MVRSVVASRRRGGKVDVFLGLDGALKLRDSVSYMVDIATDIAPKLHSTVAFPFLSTGKRGLKIRELISGP